MHGRRSGAVFDAEIIGSEAQSSMIKSQLISALADLHPHLTHAHAEKAVNCVLDEIAAALERGDRIELRGFGAFSVRHRPARKGRNPRTGETVSVKAKNVPFFKAGKELRQRVDLSANGRDDEPSATEPPALRAVIS